MGVDNGGHMLVGHEEATRRAMIAWLPAANERCRESHRGMFNLASDGTDRWHDSTSKRRPGFVWNACMAFAPGMAVRVRDAYIAEEGRLHPSLLGRISLTAQQMSNPAPGGLARGEFMRYVAEAPW